MKGNEWIKCLTEVERDNFIRNLIELREDIEFYLEGDYNSFGEFISGAFTWSNTPEGGGYWHMISLRNIVVSKYRMDKFKFV